MLSNIAGVVTSQTARVVIVQSTPATGTYRLVADRTVPIPGRPGLFFQTTGDGKLHNGIVTFQGGTNFPDLMGLYRWDGTNVKIADRFDSLPGFNNSWTSIDGGTIDENGVSDFVAASTNHGDNAIIESRNGQLFSIIDETTTILSRPGMTYNLFGYPTRGGGKVAFFANYRPSIQEQPSFRSVVVWDGLNLREWANKDAAGSIWEANSSQVGFDGNLLAFWVGDAIIYSINASPLQRLARVGDAIPGFGETYTGFRSPPHVAQGRVLFNAQSDSTGFLMEWSNGQTRIIAKTGDVVPGSVGGFSSINRGFYAGDGSVLFSATGPGTKNGVYRWSNGVLSPVVTSLNSINGRQIQFVLLDGASGNDLLLHVSFDGSNFGYWTTAGGTVGPRLSITRTSNSMTLSWPGNGRLESSSTLSGWTTETTNSPAIIQFNTGVQTRFFRVVTTP